MSMPRWCCAVRLGRLSLAALLCLALVSGALLVLPTFALAYVCSDDDGGLCQASQPPGDPPALLALLDLAHGRLLAGDPLLLRPTLALAALPDGAPPPQGLAWTLALVGRPPPLRA
jgi:hypothetical protein